MIQRIQTLFMFLSAVVCGLLFTFNLAYFQYGETYMKLSVLGVDNQIDALYFSDLYTLPLIVLASIMIALPIITSLMYKKRIEQVMLCRLDMLFNVVFILLSLLYYFPDVKSTIFAEHIKLGFGIFLPLVSFVFNLLAIRGIRKDIELLKSADRIR